jgi:glycine/D-amino acid oxidase-like deaminating enzyme/nitrite reductase/ring-hydroxylating ferredoxin subunit
MSIESKPIWDGVALPSFERLAQNVTVDVAVVGAGLTGISAACLLKRSGCRVALLDRRTVGGTDTGCTTAHLTAVTDADLPSLVQTVGRDHAQAIWDAGFAAIDQIDTLADDLGIDCDFTWVPGFRHVPFDVDEDALDKHVSDLKREAGLARELGFDVDMVSSTPLVDRPGWRIEQQALFHPRKYLRGLLREIPGQGSMVCEGSEVSFTDNPHVLSCGPYAVTAPHVVLATHNPLADRASAVSAAIRQSKLSLYTSYVLAATIPEPAETAAAAYWDLSDPYHYVRADGTAAGVRLIAGGEDHKTGQEADTRRRFAALEDWFRKLIPSAEITHRWSGQVIETADGLPFIGEVAKGQHIATGFAGNGMTFGTLAAMIIRDAITGSGPNPWAGLFDADRSAIARGPLDYLRENADYPYYLIRDRFAGAETRPLRSVRRGEGSLVEVDGRVVAASRDDRGHVTLLAAECTHLGCRVTWNQAERTWDCPCHGSRFADTGEVLAGPAERSLEPVTAGRGREAAARKS